MTGRARASAAALARLERRVIRRLDLKKSVQRAWASVPAAFQIVVGVVVAYSISHFVLGHELPILALTVTISALGFTRDARPKRVLDSVIGVTIGIAFSELMLILVGTGLWQIAIVLFLTLVIARFVSPSNAFAIAAGVQSVLVLLLPPPANGVFVRTIDGVIGGVVALLVTALIPRDPRGIARRDALRLMSTLQESVGALDEALRRGLEPAAALALERLRRTQALVDDWTVSLDSAISVARISPFLRGHLPALRHQSRVLRGADLGTRHLRVIARRIDFLVRDGSSRPELAAMFPELQAAITELSSSIDDPSRAALAQERLVAFAATLDPERIVPGAPVSASIIVLLTRPLVVDLLAATGMPVEEARALLPAAE